MDDEFEVPEMPILFNNILKPLDSEKIYLGHLALGENSTLELVEINDICWLELTHTTLNSNNAFASKVAIEIDKCKVLEIIDFLAKGLEQMQ